MCGIVGFSRDPARPVDADCSIVRRMPGPIAHRGPDEHGIHVAGPVAFGLLRLSIVDLSGGHQPRGASRMWRCALIRAASGIIP